MRAPLSTACPWYASMLCRTNGLACQVDVVGSGYRTRRDDRQSAGPVGPDRAHHHPCPRREIFKRLGRRRVDGDERPIVSDLPQGVSNRLQTFRRTTGQPDPGSRSDPGQVSGGQAACDAGRSEEHDVEVAFLAAHGGRRYRRSWLARQPFTAPAAPGTPPRADDYRSCRCRRTSRTGCATDRGARPHSPARHRS